MGEETDVEFDLNVTVDKKVMEKIEYVISEYNNELGGFMFGEVDGKNIKINDLKFPNQTVGASSVDIDMKDMVKFRGKNSKIWGKLIGFWHSHVKMGVFWSGTDMNEHIKLLGEKKPISVFIVSSDSGGFKHKCLVKITKPFEITFDNVEIKVDKDNSKIKSEMEQVIKDVVKETPIPVYNNLNGYNRGAWHRQDLDQTQVKLSDREDYKEADDLLNGYIEPDNKKLSSYSQELTFFFKNQTLIVTHVSPILNNAINQTELIEKIKSYEWCENTEDYTIYFTANNKWLASRLREEILGLSE